MPPPYHSPGRCIYCGKPASEVQLTDEHIIPVALGGTLILPKASCLDCARITSQLETHCVKGMFYAAKGQFRLKGRKSRKAPDFLGVGIERAALTEMHKLHISRHPSAIITFDFGESGASYGIAPADDFGGGKVCITPIVPDFWQRVSAIGEDIKLTLSPINSQYFARMLAKIAHAFAVAERGVDAFPHNLRNAILGQAPMYLRYFIGTVDSKSEPPSDQRHEISLAIRANWVDTELLTVRLRLFSQKETPIYYIVVTRPPASRSTTGV
jgi:hypothetical protein